jgi:hypothetical protein
LSKARWVVSSDHSLKQFGASLDRFSFRIWDLGFRV